MFLDSHSSLKTPLEKNGTLRILSNIVPIFSFNFCEFTLFIQQKLEKDNNSFLNLQNEWSVAKQIRKFNMEIINQELINKSLEFLKNITKKDKVCVIHHTDPDGVSSGVILAKAIERLRGKKIDLRHNQKGSLHSLTKETIDLLRKKEINKLLVIDIGPEDNMETLALASEIAEILIIDHHQIPNEVKILYWVGITSFSGN